MVITGYQYLKNKHNMKAIEINGNIKTFRRLPNVWENENGVYTNFRKIPDPKQFGFYDVVTPVYDKISQRLSAMFFDAENEVFTYTVKDIDLEGSHDVLDEEGNVVETKPNYDITELKLSKIQVVKDEAKKLLTPTDWYVWRLAERAIAIPQEIADERLDIINKSNIFEEEINALNTVEDVMRYSHVFYPQLTLEELNQIEE